MAPQFHNLFRALVPAGQTQIQPDNYYFWYVYTQGANIKIFNPAQLKQWMSYREEIQLVLSFLVLTGNDIDPSLFTLNPMENTNIINQPFKEFCSKECSNNTFSNFLTIANTLVPLIYLQSCSAVETHNNNPVSK